MPGTKKASSRARKLKSSLALIPQALTAKASEDEDRTTRARKAAFDLAVTKFDEFLKKFPNSAEVESAIYYKALALNQGTTSTPLRGGGGFP